MTELIWDGKYDKEGRKVPPLRVTLPFQTVETVNESAQERQRSLDLFSTGKDSDWRNRLIWGDKKYVLPSLLPEFASKVDLIYIDPPFNTGANFSFQAVVPDAYESFVKEPSVIEQKAYRDTWGKGLDSYLAWFHATVVMLQELLAQSGSLYVHLDMNVAHYAKAVLDEVFGPGSFHNEVVWKRTSAHSDSHTYNHVHDTLLFYTKCERFAWNPQFTEHSEEYQESKYSQVDEDGRRYQLTDITSPNPRPNMMYEWKGFPSPAKGWRFSKETMERLDREGRIWYPSDTSKRPRFKRYLDESSGRLLDSVWVDVPPVNSQAVERVQYRTQKPEALLERILKASSNEGDLVLDCFVGSGTTAAVAEKLGRRWIACDLGRFAIHTTRKRLLAIPDVKPFVVQNLGKYERQAWQAGEFGPPPQPSPHAGREREFSPRVRGELEGGAAARQRAYVQFILQLYGARAVNGRTWLHGIKSGRMVHVGSVDAPVTPGDVTGIAAEFRKAMGTGEDAPTTNGVDVLGWDFAFEVHEVARQQAAAANIQLRFVRIPRDVMDKRAVEQGDIRFFELAALSVEAEQKGRSVTLKLTDFTIPPDDVPEDVRRAVKHWEQWIDYWAVDWDNRSDAFHNEWQTYRTRQEKTLQKQVAHAYEEPGEYTIVVKVIDILGNDTTKALRVAVP
ncbi:MAG: site-specific DNA-methyltransferase [Armatimonadetes bacterium]|nr:site-specific DNA-methyltransferase [Armatimonadota bacterium]